MNHTVLVQTEHRVRRQTKSEDLNLMSKSNPMDRLEMQVTFSSHHMNISDPDQCFLVESGEVHI